MAWHPLTQDIRASQQLLLSDGVLNNNPGEPPDYSPYDDCIDCVHVNAFNDPDKIYFFVPAGSHTLQGRLIDKNFVESYLKGMGVTLINIYHLMELKNGTTTRPIWEYQENTLYFERYNLQDFQPTWCGYNMASQWYWLSDTDMLDDPEYIECATWSMQRDDLAKVGRILSPLMTQDEVGRELEAMYAVIKP